MVTSLQKILAKLFPMHVKIVEQLPNLCSIVAKNNFQSVQSLKIIVGCISAAQVQMEEPMSNANCFARDEVPPACPLMDPLDADPPPEATLIHCQFQERSRFRQQKPSSPRYATATPGNSLHLPPPLRVYASVFNFQYTCFVFFSLEFHVFWWICFADFAERSQHHA